MRLKTRLEVIITSVLGDANYSKENTFENGSLSTCLYETTFYSCHELENIYSIPSCVRYFALLFQHTKLVRLFH